MIPFVLPGIPVILTAVPAPADVGCLVSSVESFLTYFYENGEFRSFVLVFFSKRLYIISKIKISVLCHLFSDIISF